MKLKNCSIDSFSQKTKNKKIICFGAYVMPVNICKGYPSLHLEDRVTYLTDNDTNKWGKDFDLGGQMKKIIPPDELPEKIDAETVLLITSMYYVAIIEQLDKYPELANTECYVYPLMKALSLNEEKINPRHTKEPLIPKKIHYFWFGGNPKSELIQRCIESWYQFCPDYEIIEWNETNYDVNKARFMKEAYQEKKWGFVPDYARLDIIYQHGGIYLDTDVEMIRSFEDLRYNEAFFGLGNYGRINTGQGFGSVKGNKIIGDLLEVYKNRSFYKEDGDLDLTTCTMKETPVFVEKGFKQEDRFQMLGTTAVFPSDVFCPKFPGTDIINCTENTYSIHHHNFSWANEKEKEQYLASIQKTKDILAKMNEE